MNQNELTKTFMMIQTGKKHFVSMDFTKQIQCFKGEGVKRLRR